MDFPLADLLDHDRSTAWLLEHFHPDGLRCCRCGTGSEEAYRFRKTQRSRLQVYRCKRCQKTYTLYTGTVFEGRHLPPAQVVLLLRGFVQGVSAARLARELGLSRTTVHEIRKRVQRGAVALQPEAPLPDARTETDEMFQNAGEKRYPPC
jgi:transposase-like protein